MIAVGLAIGIVVASAQTRWLQSVLYGITPLDGVSFVASALLVSATGIAAAWWPARTAARIEPALAMREE
jgi:ABC-type antimicrobial peptide transport system permease subunit